MFEIESIQTRFNVLNQFIFILMFRINLLNQNTINHDDFNFTIE